MEWKLYLKLRHTCVNSYYFYVTQFLFLLKGQFTQRVAQTTGFLRGKTSQCSDASQRGAQIGQRVYLSVTSRQTGPIGAQKQGTRNGVQVIMFRRIGCTIMEINYKLIHNEIVNKLWCEKNIVFILTWSFEHVQHSLSDQKTASNVDRRYKSGQRAQNVYGILRHVRSTPWIRDQPIKNRNSIHAHRGRGGIIPSLGSRKRILVSDFWKIN